MTDSATVKCWLISALTGEFRSKSHGMAEMLVDGRLSVLKELYKEFDLKLKCVLIPSNQNKADVLTRVSRQWLEKVKEVKNHTSCLAVEASSFSKIKQLHDYHHFGIDRTHYLVKEAGLHVTKDDVASVV